MSAADLFGAVLLPIGLGLFGFAEPCSLGSTLVFVKAMEGQPTGTRLAQVSIFAVVRALTIGLLGVAAALVGAVFLDFQKAAWVALGLIYGGIGIAYLAGWRGLAATLGPRLSRLPVGRVSAGLGVLFGLNIPACAAPLLFALLGAAAAGGAIARGFASLALFGLALSLPLVAAVFSARARRLLDRLAGLSRRIPRWTGAVMVALGAWSIWFGLHVTVRP